MTSRPRVRPVFASPEIQDSLEIALLQSAMVQPPMLIAKP